MDTRVVVDEGRKARTMPSGPGRPLNSTRTSWLSFQSRGMGIVHNAEENPPCDAGIGSSLNTAAIGRVAVRP